MAKMNLNILLAKNNLTQQEFAEKTGINKNTISRYCNNTFEKITSSHIDTMCNFLHCTPNDIFEIEKTNIITSDDTLKNVTETYEDEIEESRLEKEIKFETNLNSIMDFLLCDHNISLLSDKFKKEAERYMGIPMITSHKFIAFHRVLYLIAVKQLKNKQIVCFMIDLIKIYNQGGLTNLKDDELNKLITESDYILKILRTNLRG